MDNDDAIAYIMGEVDNAEVDEVVNALKATGGDRKSIRHLSHTPRIWTLSYDSTNLHTGDEALKLIRKLKDSQVKSTPPPETLTDLPCLLYTSPSPRD